MKINNLKISYLVLIVIVLLSAFLRLYKLDQVPPSLSWDEAANGYNAYTIANWGKDEWGRSFPLFFKSFEDDKHPVHIYITAISVKILGLSEFSTRFPVALFGIFNVVMIFFLAKIMFKNDLIGLGSAFSLAISPYALQFSRFNHEFNFTVFFFMLGLWLFLKGVESRSKLLPLSSLAFSFSLFSYHSAKVVVPPIILLLSVLYIRQLWQIKKLWVSQLFILIIFIGTMFLNPQLLGIARINQTSFSTDELKQTKLYQQTGSELAGRAEITLTQYLFHFTPTYLFISGDKNARHSTQAVGEFYKTDLIFLILGTIFLIWRRSRFSLILLAWALIAPLPSSLVKESPHAARAMFMFGSWHLVIGIGAYSFFQILRNRYLQLLMVSVVLIIYGWLFESYITDYYQEYSKRSATEWQYGMKSVGEYVKERNGYFQVYTTDARAQPYIFFLYYLKTPLPEYLSTVEYNKGKSRSYNLVSFFDKYYFGVGDPLESSPNPGVLYMVTPSQYDGLKHREIFDVKKRIRYPDGSNAFYLVSYP